MATSRVTLRIQELAEKKVYHLLSLISGVSEDAIELYARETTANFKKLATVLEQPIKESDVNQVFEMLTPESARKSALNLLSKASNISQENVKRYAYESVYLSEETISHLKNMAEVLGVPVVNLIKPLDKKEAIKLKILEIANQKGILLEELSKKSEIYLATLCFYSTQAIEEKKLEEPIFQINLSKISKALECSVEDLKDQNYVELPPARLRINEFMSERNITLEDLSILTGIDIEFLDLLANNPIDMKNLPDWGTEQIICELICTVLGCSCK